jgi:hypothetical protein
MRKLSWFPQIGPQILFMTVVVIMLLGGWVHNANSESSNNNDETISKEQKVALQSGKTEGGSGTSTSTGEPHPCPPAACDSNQVTPGDNSGCTNGYYCSSEGTACGFANKFHCTTIRSGGTCNCSCM